MSNRNEQAASQDLGSSLGASTATAIDQMIRWPFWFTGATMDLMLQGMQRMTGPTNWAMGSRPESGAFDPGTGGGGGGRGSSSSTRVSGGGNQSSWSMFGSMGQGQNQAPSQNQTQSQSSAQDDQDLGGDDLKYVLWSILFCKPGYETVLEPQQADIVNYSADGASYAAVKIAKYLEKARHGRTERPQLWTEKGYPAAESSSAARRESPIAGAPSMQAAPERGWRIPADDQKYIKFVYRVERRLPKEEPEVTRVERVTIERGVESRTA